MLDIQRTLPASWYTSQKIVALERSAVFLRSWYFIGTVTKFSACETIHYEISQVKFTARSKPDSSINGGVQVRIYDDVTSNELPSHQTRSGLVFTAISPDAPTFNDFYPGLEDLIDDYDLTQMPYRRSLNYPGKFNWKTMIDGFQECLHCQFAHPGLSKMYPSTFYKVINHQNWSRHFADATRPDDDGLFLYFFPNTTLNFYNGGMSSFRVCPSSEPGQSRMEFDYYNSLTGEPFEEYYKFVREVADEDTELCTRAQANLEKGIYSIGCLNPDRETGVSYYQGRLLEMVTAQHKKNRRGTEEHGNMGAVVREQDRSSVCGCQKYSRIPELDAGHVS